MMCHAAYNYQMYELLALCIPNALSLNRWFMNLGQLPSPEMIHTSAIGTHGYLSSLVLRAGLITQFLKCFLFFKQHMPPAYF